MGNDQPGLERWSVPPAQGPPHQYPRRCRYKDAEITLRLRRHQRTHDQSRVPPAVRSMAHLSAINRGYRTLLTPRCDPRPQARTARRSHGADRLRLRSKYCRHRGAAGLAAQVAGLAKRWSRSLATSALDARKPRRSPEGYCSPRAILRLPMKWNISARIVCWCQPQRRSLPRPWRITRSSASRL
jgi:hypothetical protein